MGRLSSAARERNPARACQFDTYEVVVMATERTVTRRDEKGGGVNGSSEKLCQVLSDTKWERNKEQTKLYIFSVWINGRIKHVCFSTHSLLKIAEDKDC